MKLKRWLSAVLVLAMVAGLAPWALAAEPGSGDGGGTTTAAEYSETATMELEYDSVDRTSATVTYHKEGIEAPSYDLLFLVDISTLGDQAHQEFERMMRDTGLNYIFDYGADSSRMRIITYRNEVEDSGWLGSRRGALTAFNSHMAAGEGTPNEKAALDRVASIIESETENDNPTVVFWVLGNRFGSAEEEFTDSLAAL